MFQTNESSDEDANVMKTDQTEMVIEVMKECESDSTETGRVICETTDGVKDVSPPFESRDFVAVKLKHKAGWQMFLARVSVFNIV